MGRRICRDRFARLTNHGELAARYGEVALNARKKWEPPGPRSQVSRALGSSGCRRSRRRWTCRRDAAHYHQVRQDRRKKVGVCSRRCARASAFFVSSTIISLSAPSQLGKDRNRRQKIMDAIFVGTLDGIFKVARSNGDWRVASKDLPGMEVRTLRSRRFRRTRRAAIDRPMVPPINGSISVYDKHMIDVVIDRWDESAKKLKNGKAPVFTIWFSER
jgi:hypothetical protein